MIIPLFPLNTVLLPGANLPLQIFEERYLLMVSRCSERNEPFGIVLIRSGAEVGGPAEPYDIGTAARITQMQPAPGGRLHLIVTGGERFRILNTMSDQPYLTGRVELLADEDEDALVVEDSAASVRELFSEYTKLLLAANGEWTRHVGLPRRPGQLADYVASRLELDTRTRQRLLEELSVPRRLALVRRILQGGREGAQVRWTTAFRLKYGSFGVLN